MIDNLAQFAFFIIIYIYFFYPESHFIIFLFILYHESV